MKKTHKIGFFIIGASFLTTLLLKNYLAPTKILYSGEIESTEIGATVEVYFDEYGVPSIFAETDDDMFFVAGYVGARDRLFQMAFMKYAYKGQLSKVGIFSIPINLNSRGYSFGERV